MLICCGTSFHATEKIVLPEKDKLYRCLEYGICPNCGTDVSRLVEQECTYEIYTKDRRGIRALRELEKARAAEAHFKQNIPKSSKSGQNCYYGTFKKTRKKDAENQPIYLQIRKNFNNQSEILGEVVTHYEKTEEFYA